MFVCFTVLIVILTTTVSNNERNYKSLLNIFQAAVQTSNHLSLTKKSKWEKNKLVVIPAVWKEINWANRSSWPTLVASRSCLYLIILHDHMMFISTNVLIQIQHFLMIGLIVQIVHEEAGIYLKFIYDYYHDLPDKMLFIHGKSNIIIHRIQLKQLNVFVMTFIMQILIFNGLQIDYGQFGLVILRII